MVDIYVENRVDNLESGGLSGGYIGKIEFFMDDAQTKSLMLATAAALALGACAFTDVEDLARTTFKVNTVGAVTAVTRPTSGVVVKMLVPSDPDYANGLSARQTLGPDWPQIVADGKPGTC